jgi:(4-O-methyl)-D-glucuronate---lignin esterase
MKRWRISALAAVSCLLAASLAFAAQKEPPTTTDESKVPPYTIPDPLVMASGDRVTTAEMWREKRRAELMSLFETLVYGKQPGKAKGLHFETRSVAKDALGGKATRKEVRVFFSDRADGPKMDLLIYLPNDATKPVPMFIGLNFGGNHTVHKDPGITLATTWARGADKKAGKKPVSSTASEDSRGASASQWQVEKILSRGYGLATAYYFDIEPDFPDPFLLGVHQLFFKPGQTQPGPDEWGSIGAWAWGLSRALDYFETDKDIDAKRVAVMGHSRLGKTALWAGATDPRFALVISNDSGCGGAALSKRIFGETVGRINRVFPHWFCGNFKQFNENEEKLPIDQHELIALIAPRPVYVASAEEDSWADPKGEFLSALGADPVYRLLGTDGLAVKEMPPIERPVTSTIGYHIRHGKHDVTEYDWQQYLDFADKHMKK